MEERGARSPGACNGPDAYLAYDFLAPLWEVSKQGLEAQGCYKMYHILYELDHAQRVHVPHDGGLSNQPRRASLTGLLIPARRGSS